MVTWGGGCNWTPEVSLQASLGIGIGLGITLKTLASKSGICIFLEQKWTSCLFLAILFLSPEQLCAKTGPRLDSLETRWKNGAGIALQSSVSLSLHTAMAGFYKVHGGSPLNLLITRSGPCSHSQIKIGRVSFQAVMYCACIELKKGIMSNKPFNLLLACLG